MTQTQKKYYCRVCDITFKAAYDPKVQRPRRACPKCHKVVDIKKNSKKKNMPIPPQNSIGKGETASPTQIIDNPNELLITTAIRELNKSSPDVRWATILLNILDKSKQLEIKTQEGVMDKYKRMDIATRLELLKKLESRS